MPTTLPTTLPASSPEHPADGSPTTVTQPAAIGLLDRPAMLYPNHYVWFVFLAALDIMLTWIVLLSDGVEVNPVAQAILDHLHLPGMVAFKFALVVFVVIMCEWIGRRDPRRGGKLSEWAVAITAIPVTVSFVQLLVVA